MRNYIILAILSVCVLSSVLMFLPLKPNRNKYAKKHSKISENYTLNKDTETNSNEYKTDKNSEVLVVSSENSVFRKGFQNYSFDDENDLYNSFENRSTSEFAHAHRMEEKYFINSSISQHREMHSKLRNKLESVSKAALRRERTKKGYSNGK